MGDGMTIAEIGRMTIPQLLCRISDKPPDSRKQVRSFAAYEAAIKEQEAAWSDAS